MYTGKMGSFGRPNMMNAQMTSAPQANPLQAGVPTNSAASRWYGLSDQIAGKQNMADLGGIAQQANAGLSQGLSDLGFRGNNNYGSMERLASKAARGSSAAGSAAGQSKYNNLAQMYGTGLSQIELPMMQGADMQAATKNAARDGDFIGNIFKNLGL